jgi:hypothetical protein
MFYFSEAFVMIVLHSLPVGVPMFLSILWGGICHVIYFLFSL